MANEAVVIKTYGQNGSGDKASYTCASAVAISKGTILALSDPNTAATSVGTGDRFAGIASMDKGSNDNSVTISAWQNGEFNLIASGTIAVGDELQTAGVNNYVANIGAISSRAIVVGVARESASDGEVIRVRVNI